MGKSTAVKILERLVVRRECIDGLEQLLSLANVELYVRRLGWVRYSNGGCLDANGNIAHMDVSAVVGIRTVGLVTGDPVETVEVKTVEVKTVETVETVIPEYRHNTTN